MPCSHARHGLWGQHQKLAGGPRNNNVVHGDSNPSFLFGNMVALSEQQPESDSPDSPDSPTVIVPTPPHQERHRKYVTDGVAHDTVEPLRKKQCILVDPASPVILERK